MVPTPYAGGPTIALTFGSGRGTQRSAFFSIPPSRGLPACDLDMQFIFEYLSPKIFARALSLVLIEQKIVVSCKHRSLLTKFTEVLTTLMFPLKWQCVYVPVCPDVLLHILEAPMPFLLGIDSDWTSRHGLPPGVGEISLESGEIIAPMIGDSADFARPAEELPSKYVNELAKKITAVQKGVNDSTSKAQRAINPDLAFDLAPPMSESKSIISVEYFRKTVRSAALSLLVSLRWYRGFLIPPERNINSFWAMQIASVISACLNFSTLIGLLT